MLSTTISTGSLGRKVKVGYRERRAGKKHKPLTEIEIDVQRLVLLVPTNKTELPREAAADDATDSALQGLAKEASLRKPNKKESASEEGNKKEEKLREAAAQRDVTTNKAAGHDLRELSKETRLENVTQTYLAVGTSALRRRSLGRLGVTDLTNVMSISFTKVF